MKHNEFDLHTHTIASGHAYSTIAEMVQAAHNKGLKLLGMTEHTSGIPGTCADIYFLNLKVVPRQLHGVRLLMGAEINIVDYDGTLDLADPFIKGLDIRIAGVREYCYRNGTIPENTRALVKAIQNPHIDIISHPGGGADTFPVDYEPVVEAAKKYHTLLEVNNGSLRTHSGPVYRPQARRMLELCKEYQQPVILSSDAHVFSDVANLDHVMPLIEEVGFPSELIMNYSAERLLDYLAENRRNETFD